MGLGAKSLILDLLATLRPGAVMPVGALVEAGELFGLSSNNVRVSAARLLAAGQIARDERGCYRLGPKSQSIGQRIRSWRALDRRTRAWSGSWIGVRVERGSRSAARDRKRALGLLGLEKWRSDLWLRPDNLSGGVAGVRSELVALGLPRTDVVFSVSNLDDTAEAQARGLWDVAGICGAYGHLLGEVAAGTRRLADLAPSEAMIESFLLGGRVLRSLLRDPLLPEEICPGAQRQELLEAMRSYDRLGRSAWAGLLRKWEVPYRRAPLDGGMDVSRPRLVG